MFSRLGPLLFLVYFNDIDYICCGRTIIQLSADDVKLYSKIDIRIGSLALQQSFDRFAEWQLTINVNKCAVLSFDSKSQPALHAYFIDGLAISRHDSYVDLGVTTSSNFSNEQHIHKIVSKVWQHISILRRGLLFRSLDTIRLPFITYIRPLLEYSSIIWTHTCICLIDLIENV
jgi:hypothetical protein